MYRWLLLACLAGCAFPTEGVPLTGDQPDAEVVPPDACAPVTEVCDGLDNDCDSNVDEGVSSGAACDGPDADLCVDDTMICDATGAEVCAPGADNPELCNAMDEDCDNVVDEGFVLGMDNCDGADGDECDEGDTVCSVDGLSTTCTDVTDTILETCNMADDDCDGVDDDGFDTDTDELNCGECERACTNPRGSTSCLTGLCTPVCNNGAANCDADVDNGCELVDTNPACPNIALAAGPDAIVNGDVNGNTVVLNGTAERFVWIHVDEDCFPSCSDPITARITLTSGAGTDFDLFVYCTANCGVSPSGPASDIREVGHADINGNDRQFDVLAEIRYDPSTPSTSCAQWTLTIVGDPTALPPNGPVTLPTSCP